MVVIILYIFSLCQAIENLFVLLDLNLQILGQSQQEDKIWDEILAARATLGEAKKTRQVSTLLILVVIK